ncbi:hypothetical protein [Miltoncostaea oceani]|uniref:hypothetical protein n=1 Tax=Miltoncostaea oceani TaxID=2843216 RepID=UPI001C3C763D|nr:hypothetical protein [Miltoncostaea oceani]
MATALLVAAVLVGVAACPLMSVIQRRRGRDGCSSSRSRTPGAAENLAELRADRARVQERIVALERDASTGGRAAQIASTRRP